MRDLHKVREQEGLLLSTTQLYAVLGLFAVVMGLTFVLGFYLGKKAPVGTVAVVEDPLVPADVQNESVALLLMRAAEEEAKVDDVAKVDLQFHDILPARTGEEGEAPRPSQNAGRAEPTAKNASGDKETGEAYGATAVTDRSEDQAGKSAGKEAQPSDAGKAGERADAEKERLAQKESEAQKKTNEDQKSSRGSKDKESKDNDSKDTADRREAGRDPKTGKDSKESKDAKDAKDTRTARDSKDLKPAKDAKEAKDSKETKVAAKDKREDEARVRKEKELAAEKEKRAREAEKTREAEKASAAKSAEKSDAVARKEKSAPEKEVKKPAVEEKKPEKSTGKGFTVQVSSYQEAGVADKLVRQLLAQGFSAYKVAAEVNGHTWYRVRIGSFDNRDGAEKEMQRLKAARSELNPMIAHR